MEQPLLSPQNGYVFKRIFGDESNKKVLISLLNAILQIKIRDITFFSQEIPRKAPLLKNAVLDIVAQLDDETHVDIEMQAVFHKECIDHILHYWAELFTRQPVKGETRYTLKKTISITILGDGKSFFPHAHSTYKLMECHSDPMHILIDKEEFHFIDVGRAEEIAKIESNEKLINWMKFFKSQTREEMKALAEQDVCIGRAVQTLEIMSSDENDVYQAWARDKFLWDQEVRERGAEKKGREEGKIETAKAMLTEGIAIETICKITGLDVSDFTE